MKIRVLIVDDQRLFRSALRCLLEIDPAIDVIGEASNGLEACSMAILHSAQVACMDFRMAQMDGVESTRLLLAALPQLKIIGLSANCDAATEDEMRAAGAATYVAKQNAAEQLLPAIHALFACGEPIGDAPATAVS